MDILLSGATGFTGRFFKKRAEAQGHNVTSLTANLTEPAAVAAEVAQSQPDAVVHLAAISFVGHSDDTSFYAVNVVGTMNLLAALAALPKRPRQVLLASSANVYGNCAASPICEKELVAPLNHYAMSKLAMEQLASTYLDRLPIVVTRPFNYTGAGQASHFLIPKLVSHFSRQAASVELGNLHVEREFNDVRMVVEAYLRLLELGQPGQVYNVCSGQPHTLHQVLETLQTLTGHSLQVRVNPAFVRANEVHRLCGSPAKLLACTGPIATFTLRDTLSEMLNSCT